MHVVICYDILKNSVRQRIAKRLLQARGKRVQKSVFELDIRKSEYLQLQKDLKILARRKDFINYYPLCIKCKTMCESIPAQAAEKRKRHKTVDIV